MTTNVAPCHEAIDAKFRTILGVKFFNGDGPEAIREVEQGGLVLVPSGPGLKTLPDDRPYRDSLMAADLVLADSALMVMLWNLLERDSLRRLSGLEYMRDLLQSPDFRALHGTFWVMPSAESAKKNLAWLREQGIEVAAEDVYIAPRYDRPIEDPVLVDLRRSGAHSSLGGPVGVGLVDALLLEAKTLHSQVLGCPQTGSPDASPAPQFTQFTERIMGKKTSIYARF